MNENLNSRITSFRLAISVFLQMLKSGIISEAEFIEIESITAKECGLNSSTIFTDITGHHSVLELISVADKEVILWIGK